MSRPTPKEVFHAWMRQKFKKVGKNADSGYTIIGPRSHEYNCLAHAVGQTTIRLTPQTFGELVNIYEFYGFYQIGLNGPPHPHDAEVYAKPTEPTVPLHAHRIEGPVSAGSEVIICSSKMGDDFPITHPRDLLQCKRATSERARYEYGLVQYRFRFDQARYAMSWESYTQTRSGRVVKQSENFPSEAMKEVRRTETSPSVSICVVKRPKISFRIIMKPEVSIRVTKKTKVSISIIKKPKVSIIVTKKPKAITTRVIKRSRTGGRSSGRGNGPANGTNAVSASVGRGRQNRVCAKTTLQGQSLQQI